jgi:hypothetical protein
MMRVDECNKVLLDGFEAMTTLSVDCGSPYLKNDFFFVVEGPMIVNFIKLECELDAELKLN